MNHCDYLLAAHNQHEKYSWGELVALKEGIQPRNGLSSVKEGKTNFVCGKGNQLVSRPRKMQGIQRNFVFSVLIPFLNRIKKP